MNWSHERVDALRTFWANGLSASEIAARLGNVTRNAVIGKVHRLGLQGGATRSRLTRRPTRTPAPRVARRSTRLASMVHPPLSLPGAYDAPIEAAQEPVIPPGERRSILTLTPNCCRWPIGDPMHEGFHFCGRRRLPDRPYCDGHARRAFRTPHGRNDMRALPASLRPPRPHHP
jgi:GcrA cell cycle regulator